MGASKKTGKSLSDVEGQSLHDAISAATEAPAVGDRPGRIFWILTVAYAISVALMFALPRLLASDSDGFVEATNAAGIVFLFGGTALIISVVSAVLVCIRKGQLSTLGIVVGLFPLVATIIWITVLAILVNANNDTNSNNDPVVPCSEGQDGTENCLTPKNPN